MNFDSPKSLQLSLEEMDGREVIEPTDCDPADLDQTNWFDWSAEDRDAGPDCDGAPCLTDNDTEEG